MLAEARCALTLSNKSCHGGAAFCAMQGRGRAAPRPAPRRRRPRGLWGARGCGRKAARAAAACGKVKTDREL